MSVFVAMLRGVDVGDKNKLSMKGLADLLECLGRNDARSHAERRGDSRKPFRNRRRSG